LKMSEDLTKILRELRTDMNGLRRTVRIVQSDVKDLKTKVNQALQLARLAVSIGILPPILEEIAYLLLPIIQQMFAEAERAREAAERERERKATEEERRKIREEVMREVEEERRESLRSVVPG